MTGCILWCTGRLDQPEGDVSGQNEREPMPLSEAASRLGISPEALRKRLKRGTADGFRDNRQRWMVYVDPDASTNRQDNRPDDVGAVDLDSHPLVVQLREQVADLQNDVSASRDREARLLSIVEGLSEKERRDLGAIERLRQWLFGTSTDSD